MSCVLFGFKQWLCQGIDLFQGATDQLPVVPVKANGDVVHRIAWVPGVVGRDDRKDAHQPNLLPILLGKERVPNLEFGVLDREMPLDNFGVLEWDCVFNLKHGSILTSMKKSELIATIQESIKKALLEQYDEDPALKKIRLEGRRKAIEKYGNATVEELSRALLKIEKQMSDPANYKDEKKSAFADGAVVWITQQIKKLGGTPPRPGGGDPWSS